MIVECVGCGGKFTVHPENFADYEIIFCPTCELSHQINKKGACVTVTAVLKA
ncbi:MAG: hypothetical protein NWF00_02335 [Candidatus Bathyarchaeota archaeon]|nr:hypothetical protein [Candidatus Bathyarchaeota archaeon]